MPSIDISAAYRSILVHPDNWEFHSIQWLVNGVLTYLCDTHLCFRPRCAPSIFTQASNFVLRCLQRLGFSCVLSTWTIFLFIGRSKQECERAQLTLIEILRSLGFYIAWEKGIAPSQCSMFNLSWSEVQYYGHDGKPSPREDGKDTSGNCFFSIQEGRDQTSDTAAVWYTGTLF